MSEDNATSEGAAHERNQAQQEKEWEQKEKGKTVKQIADDKAHMGSEEAAERRNIESRRDSKKKRRKAVSKGGGEKVKVVKKKSAKAKAKSDVPAVGGTFDYSRSRDLSQDLSSNRDTSEDYSRTGLRSPKAIAEEKSNLRTEEIAKAGAPGADELADTEKGYSRPKGKK